MEFPIRCFSCGSVIAHLHEKYEAAVKEGKEKGATLDELGVDKYCCRRMFISYVNIMEDTIKYEKRG